MDHVGEVEGAVLVAVGDELSAPRTGGPTSLVSAALTVTFRLREDLTGPSTCTRGEIAGADRCLQEVLRAEVREEAVDFFGTQCAGVDNDLGDVPGVALDVSAALLRVAGDGEGLGSGHGALGDRFGSAEGLQVDDPAAFLRVEEFHGVGEAILDHSQHRDVPVVLAADG